jgi:hypothetical protein
MAGSHLALEAVVHYQGQTVARCLLRRGRYVIGQQRKNEIVVDAESVSSTHARLTVVTDGQFFLEDLGSANGTFVNGRAIHETTPVTLECEIALGQATLTFQRGGLPASVFQHLPENFLRASRYTLGDPIVEGRTSTIYEAHDTSLQRTVALRVLRPECQASPAQVLAFIRDVQITAQLPHTSILPIYDFGLDEEIGLFFATRFLEGESLANLLNGMASGDPQAPHANLYSLLFIFLKTCDAVALAHARGVVHGALRPEAIIFGRFGEVFVDHWGFAQISTPPDAEAPLVQAPALTTAPPISRYTTPEQAADADGLDARTDVHALGAILFRILTLRHFNQGESEQELRAQALDPRHTPAEALAAQPLPAYLPGGHLPERLALACIQALSFAREDRFANAHDLKKEVAGWLEDAVAGGEHSKIWKQLAGLLGRR